MQSGPMQSKTEKMIADTESNTGSTQSTINQKCKIVYVNNDKNIILTRENGEQQQY